MPTHVLPSQNSVLWQLSHVVITMDPLPVSTPMYWGVIWTSRIWNVPHPSCLSFMLLWWELFIALILWISCFNVISNGFFVYAEQFCVLLNCHPVFYKEIFPQKVQMKYCFTICLIQSNLQQLFWCSSDGKIIIHRQRTLSAVHELSVLPVLPLCFKGLRVFSIDWPLFSGKTIYSSFSDNYTYGICILIKKTVVMSDSYKQKFIIRTLFISLKCSLSFFPGFLNCKSQLNYVLWGVNFWHHMSLKMI